MKQYEKSEACKTLPEPSHLAWLGQRRPQELTRSQYPSSPAQPEY